MQFLSRLAVQTYFSGPQSNGSDFRPANVSPPVPAIASAKAPKKKAAEDETEPVDASDADKDKDSFLALIARALLARDKENKTAAKRIKELQSGNFIVRCLRRIAKAVKAPAASVRSNREARPCRVRLAPVHRAPWYWVDQRMAFRRATRGDCTTSTSHVAHSQ